MQTNEHFVAHSALTIKSIQSKCKQADDDVWKLLLLPDIFKETSLLDFPTNKTLTTGSPSPQEEGKCQ